MNIVVPLIFVVGNALLLLWIIQGAWHIYRDFQKRCRDQREEEVTDIPMLLDRADVEIINEIRGNGKVKTKIKVVRE